MKRILVVLMLVVAACGDSPAATTLATTTTAAPATTAATTTTTTTAAATTTIAATTTEATTTTVPVPVFGFFVDGLGVVDFGASPEAVVAALTPLFGASTQDTGWIAEIICPPPLYRLMGFGPGSFDFTVIFTTAEFFAPAGTEQFFGYSYHGELVVPVSPPELTVGTTLAELQALYPAVVIAPHELIDDAYSFEVTGEGNERVRGALNGNAADSTVIEIRGGGSCGE